eukprot:7151272-Pyramimonas_sp.AAC.1
MCIIERDHHGSTTSRPRGNHPRKTVNNRTVKSMLAKNSTMCNCGHRVVSTASGGLPSGPRNE